MKAKLTGKLGVVGIILFYVFSIAISILPFVIIDTNFFWTMVCVTIMQIFPISSIIFWVWGLIVAISEPQDFISIIYYICFAILFIPSFVSDFINLIKIIKEKISKKENSIDTRKTTSSKYKIATIILSVVLALSLTFTIVLTVNTTNLNNENSELKLENENLQLQIRNKDIQIQNRGEKIDELEEEVRAKDKKYLYKVFFLETKIAFIDADDNYYYHTFDCPNFENADSYYAHNIEYAISQGYVKHSCW